MLSMQRTACNTMRADSAARGGLLYRSAHARVTYYARPVPAQMSHAGSLLALAMLQPIAFALALAHVSGADKITPI